MTRTAYTISGYDIIEFWNTDDKRKTNICDSEFLLEIMNKDTFKKLFPTEKLPRKGSKTYISHLKIIRG